jgi:hypothetical protein
MKRLAFAFVLVSACSAKPKPTGAGDGSGSGPAIYAKKIAVTWGIQTTSDGADLFLQTTDETGKQVSHPLGHYLGKCQVFTPAKEMNAVTGIGCDSGGSGIELHAVVRGDDIIVVKLNTKQGVTPDPMAREEVTRVTAPIGAKIEAGT